jgi:hypothetical protein
MKSLFKILKNKNFLALVVINFTVIIYIFGVFMHFGLTLSLGTNHTIFIALATTLLLCLGLLIFAISRIRTWVILLFHFILGLAAFLYLREFGIKIDYENFILIGVITGSISYIFFGTALWFLIRFKNSLVTLSMYSLVFIGGGFLEKIDALKDLTLSSRLGSLNTFIFLIIFFLLLSMILYFENLLKFANDLNQPARTISRGLLGFFFIIILISIPILASLNAGVDQANFYQKQDEQEQIAEELKILEVTLKQKEIKISELKESIDNSHEDPELEFPQRSIPTISIEKRELEKQESELKNLEQKKEELKQKQAEPEVGESKNTERLNETLQIGKSTLIVFLILMSIYISFYILIYPFIRLFVVKNKVNKASDQIIKVIVIYVLIISIAKWFGVKFKKSSSPTEIIKSIEKAFEIDLYDMGWIYNRGMLRGKLESTDVLDAQKAFTAIWENRFVKNKSVRSILYFYRVGRIIR